MERLARVVGVPGLYVHLIDNAADGRIEPARGIIQAMLSVPVLVPQLVPMGLAKPRLSDQDDMIISNVSGAIQSNKC